MKWHKDLAQKLVTQLPSITRGLLKPLPDRLIEKMLEREFNRALSRPLREGSLSFLNKQQVAIEVCDIQLIFFVKHFHNTLHITLSPVNAQVKFKAKLADLLVLIGGLQDPDTLFFRRQLVISGDTDLALQIKNFLDQLEPRKLMPAPVFNTLRCLGKAHMEQTLNKSEEKNAHVPV